MPNVQITEQPLWRELRNQRDGEAPADRILAFFGIVTPAVDVEGIAKALGFRILESPLIEESGGIDTQSTPAVIKVRSVGQARVRRRFTIAHEIGHAMLHNFASYHRDDYFNGDLQEVQANRFAADLLMPKWMVERFVGGRGVTVGRLAEKFDVSAAAMELRLRNMGVIL